MRRHWLREKLIFLVTMTCATALTAVGPMGCSSSGDDNGCTVSVVERTFNVSIDSKDACTLAKTLTNASYSPSARGEIAGRCRALCGDSAVTHCALPANYTADFLDVNPEPYDPDAGPRTGVCPALREGLSVLPLTCQVLRDEPSDGRNCAVEGRRPAGWSLSAASTSAGALAAYFGDCAELEAASVFAFDVLARDLTTHGAPDDLIAGARASAKDEIRHAKVTRRLAERFGATVNEPQVETRGDRALYEVALENAVEGVVRETFGAAVALWRAERAEDVVVRRAMRSIAADECNHAVLSWRIATWARGRLDAGERARIDAAVAAEIARLREGLASDPAPELSTRAGVPTAREAAMLLDGLEADVWTRAA